MDGLLPRLTRPLLTALLALAAMACGAVPAAARADAAPPSARWPVGGSTLRVALAMGAEHWGMTPCGGRVTMAWTPLDPGINARSSWANDVDPYLQPSSNVACEIALSPAVDWDWVKLCSILIHEVGHLTGHDHVDDPDDVMYYAYVQPVAECAAAAEPVETGPPPIVASKATTRVPAKAHPRRAPKRRAPVPRRARRSRR